MLRTLRYDIADVLPYINWLYFYHAWQMSRHTDACRDLQADALALAGEWQGKYHTIGRVLLADAHSDGDDIVLDTADGIRLPMLRQQGATDSCLCLADFIAPEGRGGEYGKLAVFCTTADVVPCDMDTDPYMSLLSQTLADRLAEATAEILHRYVRTTLWGYAKDESLSIPDMLANRFVGIRPAVGYPSLPDLSLNFVINDILDMGTMGITLTENGAMRPHATVTGLMFSHPEARYFSVGAVAPDQLTDYSTRRGMPVARLQPFLTNTFCK